MGTTGDNTILEKVFGSISSDVSKYAHCPVMLVPNGAKFEAYQNIVYASDFEKIYSIIMDKIADFAGRFSAGIHLVDVNENVKKGRYKVSEQLLEQKLNDKLPKLEFKSMLGIWVSSRKLAIFCLDKAHFSVHTQRYRV